MKTQIIIKIDESITITVNKEIETAQQSNASQNNNLVKTYTYGQQLNPQKEQSGHSKQ